MEPSSVHQNPLASGLRPRDSLKPREGLIPWPGRDQERLPSGRFKAIRPRGKENEGLATGRRLVAAKRTALTPKGLAGRPFVLGQSG